MRRGWTNKANLQDGTDVTSCGSDMGIGYCQFVESSPLLGLGDGARAAAGVMMCARGGRFTYSQSYGPEASINGSICLEM